MSTRRFHLETLGCPKNEVDSEKMRAALLADGLVEAPAPEQADLVVVNTCAFVEAARTESIDAVLMLADARKRGARLVVTGCLAERYGADLAAALPEADAVVGFAGEAEVGRVGLRPDPGANDSARGSGAGVGDLLDLPRPAPRAPWAYLKIAEGCDRACAFCAIPSFRGAQRSRAPEAIEHEARGLVEAGAAELVLVAQDLLSYGRDAGEPGALPPLLRQLDALADAGLRRLRLLYLYPSEVRDTLVATMLELPTVVPYFDLSLQHSSARLLRAMKRVGGGDRFLALLDRLRREEPGAAFRSSFLVGFPGETEDDHDELLAFLAAARLDWAGFFAFSPEDGTPAASLGGTVPSVLVGERLRECADVQDPITAAARASLLGREVELLVDGPGEDGRTTGRTHREAPEIDGVVSLVGAPADPGDHGPQDLTGVEGTDLEARRLTARQAEWRAG